MLTARALCLAVGMLFLASCGSGDRDFKVLTHLDVPQGMTEIGTTVAPISVAPGDRVDVLMMQNGQEIVVLQNVEVLRYDRDEIPQQELESLRDLHDELEAHKMFEEEDLTFLVERDTVDRVDLAVTEEEADRFNQEIMHKDHKTLKELLEPLRLHKL